MKFCVDSSMRLALVLCLFGLPALGATPGVQQALDRADLVGCLGLAPHPDAPVRVTIVVHADGAWAVGLDPFEDAPIEVFHDCVTNELREALAGLVMPRREAVFSRVVWPPAGPSERFEERRESISECVLDRLPKLNHLIVRLRLTTSASGALRVAPVSSPAGAREAAACARLHLVELSPMASEVEVELGVDRPGALPPHDGTLDAVCHWGEGHDEPKLPTPRPCRAGLVCRACSGGIEQNPPVERDRHCVSPSFQCPAVP